MLSLQSRFHWTGIVAACAAWSGSAIARPQFALAQDSGVVVGVVNQGAISPNRLEVLAESNPATGAFAAMNPLASGLFYAFSATRWALHNTGIHQVKGHQ